MIAFPLEFRRALDRLKSSVGDLSFEIGRLGGGAKRLLTSADAFCAWLRVAAISLVILSLILLAVAIEQRLTAAEPASEAWAAPAAALPDPARITSREMMRWSFMREQLEAAELGASGLPAAQRCKVVQRGGDAAICIYQEGLTSGR